MSVSKYSNSREMKPFVFINWAEKGINKNYNRNELTIFISISLFFFKYIFCLTHFLPVDDCHSVMVITVTQLTA
jgi:hypothetical protein